MTRVAWVFALAGLGLVGCGDEVVGFLASDSESSNATESETQGEPGEDLPDFVAFGFDGGILSSFDDGTTWVLGDEPPLDPEVERLSLARGADRIVIVGAGETLVSTDGRAWTRFGDGLGYARAVAWGAGTFVSVGQGRRARSVDGEGWIDAREGDFESDFNAVAYGDGRFVAVGQDVMGTSTDGETWEVTAIDGAQKLHAIAYGNGRFIAVAEEGRIAVTFDGLSLASDEQTSAFYGGIEFCDGEFVAISHSTVRLSADGDEWREVAIDPAWSVACTAQTVVTLDETLLRRGPDLLTQEPVHTAQRALHDVAYTGATLD